MPAPGFSISFELTGWQHLMFVLSRSRRRSAHVMAAALYQEGQVIFGVAVRYTPIRFGILRASGHVVPPIVFNDRVEMSIVFGGAAAPYAWWVHERITTKRGKIIRHDHPTRAKFLSTAIEEAQQTIEARLSRRISGLFEAGYAGGV